MPPAAIFCSENSAMRRLRSARAYRNRFLLSLYLRMLSLSNDGRPSQEQCRNVKGNLRGSDATAFCKVPIIPEASSPSDERRWSCSRALISAGRGNFGALRSQRATSSTNLCLWVDSGQIVVSTTRAGKVRDFEAAVLRATNAVRVAWRAHSYRTH